MAALVDERRTPVDDLLVLDEAIDNLSQADPKVADLVKLRFFAGLTGEQAANLSQYDRRILGLCPCLVATGHQQRRRHEI